jgi:hypothetical protein
MGKFLANYGRSLFDLDPRIKQVSWIKGFMMVILRRRLASDVLISKRMLLASSQCGDADRE